MFERLDVEVKGKVERATELAAAEGSATVEAEHLLLALVDPADDAVGRALVGVGMSAGSIREARDRLFQSTLASVGVETKRPAPVAAARLRRGRRTSFGQSAKLAIERTLASATRSNDGHIGTAHLLWGVVAAEVGMTPALLAELGTTADDLGTKLEG